jgi:holo-[acyl-carrier protein] synthase
MIKGIGIDAVETERMAKIVKEKPQFAKRVLTSKELEWYDRLPFHRQVEFLGGRFACKEAFSKAWGTGIGKVSFQDIEVLANCDAFAISVRCCTCQYYAYRCHDLCTNYPRGIERR